MWELDSAEGHRGRVGVLLEDGSVPGPVYYDIGSGASFHKSAEWHIYDGTLGAPRADRMRAACACGWYGEAAYPIEWDRVSSREPYHYDTSGPQGDWATHAREVAALARPLPEDVAALLSRLRTRVDELENSDILAGLRVMGELESVIGCSAPYFARAATGAYPEEEIARALGSTRAALTTRLRRYDRPAY
ncbi:hypothetical protein [Streptomyces laurentii]|uniref:Uncharacterized protein n=1 Tax=Streptomyces laurentii TaxID=39478 RepID=A0A160NUB6_STRLU|nr:hypothetical protein SLA_0440 [Streptomyces laurentii]